MSRVARVAALVALALYGVGVARTAWVSDDAFITLRTVDHLVSGHGLRWNADERVQAFTHPLWLAAIAPPYALTREPYFTTLALSLAVSCAAALLVLRRFRETPWAGCAVLAALAASRAFVDYSTSGLENPLSHLLWILFITSLDAGPPTRRSLTVQVALAAAAGLNRTDSLLLYAPALAASFLRVRGGKERATALLGASPLLLWSAFSVFYYGIPYPNTALAKIATGLPMGEVASQGVAYFANSLRWDFVTLPVVGLALAIATIRRERRALGPALGIVLQLAYVVAIGGDFMSGRFFSLPCFAAACLLGDQLAKARPAWSWGLAPAVLAAGLLARVPATALDPTGIADERRLSFACLGLWNDDPWGPKPCAAMREDGLRLRDSGAAVGVLGAIGVGGYYAGPRAHVFDFYALADPLLSRLPMVEADPIFPEFLRAAGLPPSPRTWRPGHFLRAFPPGYLESAVTGRNTIRDPEIAALWEKVRLATRAPLGAEGRLKAIASLVASGGGALDGRAREPMTPIPWPELERALPGDPEVRYAMEYEARGSGR